MGPVELDPDRAGTGAQHVGDFGRQEPGGVPQHDDRPLLVGQALEQVDELGQRRIAGRFAGGREIQSVVDQRGVSILASFGQEAGGDLERAPPQPGPRIVERITPGQGLGERLGLGLGGHVGVAAVGHEGPPETIVFGAEELVVWIAQEDSHATGTGRR